MAAVTAALERAGVRFLAAADGLGQGVRYERLEPASTGACAPELHPASGMAATGRVADAADRRVAAARRRPVGRLGRAGS